MAALPAWADPTRLRDAFLKAGFVEYATHVAGAPRIVMFSKPTPPGVLFRGHPEWVALVPVADLNGPDVVATALTVALLTDAIQVLEAADGPHPEFGPLTEREATAEREMAALRESLAGKERGAPTVDDLVFETDDHPNLDPPEQVGRVSWKQNGRTLCSVWFPDDAQGWRFHMAGDDCGWSRTRYDTPEAAALAYWDAVHAYPTTAPWFASTDAAL